jgi:type II secretory pathway pseudopilin PulG
MKCVPSSGRESNSARAFTIVEVMIGVMVMFIVFVTVYMGFSQGFATIRITQENLRATQILEEQTEIIRLYTWEQLTNTTASKIIPTTKPDYFYPNGIKKGIAYLTTITITNSGLSESYSNDIKRVTFQVTWTSGKRSQTNSMTTLVSHYGLHNYW